MLKENFVSIAFVSFLLGLLAAFMKLGFILENQDRWTCWLFSFALVLLWASIVFVISVFKFVFIYRKTRVERKLKNLKSWNTL